METMKKDLEYYRKNAEEDYLTTPISVLRYITEIEQALRIHDVVWQSEQLLAYTEWLKNKGLLNATVSKLIVKKYQSK